MAVLIPGSVTSEDRGRVLVRSLVSSPAIVVGIAAFLVSVAGSWRPSFWIDESATVTAANRPMWDLGYLTLARADAVHGLYYFLMNGWFRIAGVSEFSSRLPSAIGIGLAAAGIVVLGEMLANRRIGVLAGLVFAILPRTTLAGSEARSYALAAAAAVVLTIVFVLAVRERTPRIWLVYAVGVLLCVCLFLYLVTVVLAHLVTLLLRPATRRVIPGWTVAVGSCLIVSLPFTNLARTQGSQLDWIPGIDRHVVRSIFEYQWFPGALLLAVVAHLLVLYTFTRARARRESDADLLVVVAPWVVVPTVALVAYSVLYDPIYIDRYLTFGAPAVALLLGYCIDRLASNGRLQVAIVAGLAVLALPAYLDQRESFGKYNGTDFSQTADYMRDNASPGDCVVYDSEVSWLPSTMRPVQASNPSDFEGLVDVGLAEDRLEVHDFWDRNLPDDQIAERAIDCRAIWVLTDVNRYRPETFRHTTNQVWELPPHRFVDEDLYTQLRERGFRIERTHDVHMTQVVLMVPNGS